MDITTQSSLSPTNMQRNRPSETDGASMTNVDLIWIEGSQENWIRFGKQAGERIIDRRRRVFSFAPNSIFAFIRWRSNDYGTIHSSIDIVSAVKLGEAYSTLPGIHPGGEILLHIKGWPKVSKMLQVIDAVEGLGFEPDKIAPDYWRHVHSRMTVGEQPRGYSLARHKAWLARLRVES
ncbi:DUF2840 domain-containing protein [Parasphingorhabdus sp.]|uniref:DUF2840 domain-containing protein n=1 Tax=Parasphingorhabdus sp. TaxID=2709688 RepID=UPI003D2CE07A